MDWLSIIFSNIGGVIITTLLLIFLDAMGVLDKLLALFKKNGNNGYQLQIDELKEHSRVANSEMGEIRKDISDIKADISFIKGKLSQ